ncbi:dihydrolipoamide acetyltransferase family protein [Pricia sp. S334]|uniref:Dihydrolipoamide acetyltransferase component of pyruvate dehydrogenase complex n=1 Tax=Pricia mediterranea TaxID=3076079 RepID=A0ABU3L363_9FLAO|nr:dihydrolipoamide acetyltransferase family protein [Pricia sp. S334]MDT7827634.1 dihydrolipoamide acetyltransferase family protein [Pricia sp. S334]
MSKFELKLPRMGESVAEATLTTWLKDVGDTVELDEPVFEIATDKVDSEVPSEVEGVLIEKHFEVDDVVKVGQTVAVIEIEGGASDSPGSQGKAFSGSDAEDQTADKEKSGEQAAAEVEESVKMAKETASAPKHRPDTPQQDSERFYSPLVKNIAKQEGISLAELDGITGSGLEGRVTKNDILQYVEERTDAPAEAGSRPKVGAAPATEAAGKQAATERDRTGQGSEKGVSTPERDARATEKPAASTVSSSDGHEIIEMTRMGKMIAKHMVDSVSTSAHVQSFIEVDVTPIVNWRNKVKADFEKREGEKLTFTPIFLEAVAKALKKYPMMNISVEGDTVVKKKSINIGMAAALPDGNLIVPVIKNADQLNLVGMAKVVNDLATRARENGLKPDEVQGGTYTVTNVGTFGSVFGTPIINQPQVGILALGAIRKLPAVIETEAGDFIGIRSKMFLSHSYDHRVVNGALGSMFVKAVADYLEAWDTNREV